MKKIVATATCLCLSIVVNAQLNFSTSGTNAPQNFVIQNLLAVSPSEVYAVGALNTNPYFTAKIYKSVDNGMTWSNSSFNGIGTSQFIFLSMCYNGSTYFLSTQNSTASNNIIYSSGDAVTWTASGNGVPLNFLALDMIDKSSSEIYAVGAIFNSGWQPTIYSSSDGGANWSGVNFSGINSAQTMFTTICYTGTKLLVATQDNQASDNGVYSSTNGITWTSSNSGMPSNFLTQDLIFISSTEIYASGAINNNSSLTPALYRSSDGGSTWVNIPVTGIGANQEIYTALGFTGSRLLMTTQDHMAIDCHIYGLTLQSTQTDLTNNIEELFFSCFPNPASQTVKLTASEEIKKIYVTDMTGNIIFNQIPDREQSSIDIDVSLYTKGLYLLTVQGKDHARRVRLTVE